MTAAGMVLWSAYGYRALISVALNVCLQALKKRSFYYHKYLKSLYDLIIDAKNLFHHIRPPFSPAPPTSTVFSKSLPCPNINIGHTQQRAFRHHFLKERPMHKQIGKIGAIRRELDGRACPFCGGHKYQLVLRGNMQPQAGELFARCSQCQRPRGLDEDLGRILWM